jgi:hypothetical protein
VRLSYADFMTALNAGRPAVRDALRAAEKLGELEIVEAGKGTRAALYRLSKAVGYVRPASSSGSNFKPLEGSEDRSSGSENEPQGPNSATASGSNFKPQASASGSNFDASGSNFKPHHQNHNNNPSTDEGRTGGQRDALREAQPLIDAMTDAGLIVSWTMRTEEWRELLDLLDRVDVSVLVQRAAETRRPGQRIQYATYFLRGTWRGLPTTKGRKTPRPSSKPDPRADWPEWCKDPDCDEVTRRRQVEDDNGIRTLVRCPQCHPTRKESAA